MSYAPVRPPPSLFEAFFHLECTPELIVEKAYAVARMPVVWKCGEISKADPVTHTDAGCEVVSQSRHVS
jgi:hypothetical protein